MTRMNHRLPVQKKFCDLREAVLKRDQKCMMCGRSETKHRSLRTNGPLKLTVGVRTVPELGGKYTRRNLRAICLDCAEGLDELPYVVRRTRIRTPNWVSSAPAPLLVVAGFARRKSWISL